MILDRVLHPPKWVSAVTPPLSFAAPIIIGSGGYMPEDVQIVQEITASGKWDLERIITHEFPLVELEQAICTAGDVDHAGNVVVKMKKGSN